jgi:hypothetical protein
MVSKAIWIKHAWVGFSKSIKITQVGITSAFWGRWKSQEQLLWWLRAIAVMVVSRLLIKLIGWFYIPVFFYQSDMFVTVFAPLFIFLHCCYTFLRCCYRSLHIQFEINCTELKPTNPVVYIFLCILLCILKQTSQKTWTAPRLENSPIIMRASSLYKKIVKSFSNSRLLK